MVSPVIRRSRSYLRLSLVAAAALMAMAAMIVVGVDPLWLSPIDFGLAHFYCVKDERQNKTDKLAFGTEAYDTLLIGSSRANNDVDFSRFGMRTFTYALSGLFPQEYKGYVDFFTRMKGAPKTILLAVDFYGAAVPTEETLLDRPPEDYVHRTDAFDFRLRNILSWHVLDYARTTLFDCAPEPGAYGVFTRDGRMHVARWPTLAEAEAYVNANVNWYRIHRYGTSYAYNERVGEIFRTLRAAYPQTRFIVFVPPETAMMGRLVAETGHLDDYGRWLGTLVDIFGEVYDFGGINSISMDIRDWWYDGHHLYPELTQIVYDRLLGTGGDNHIDFGERVTKDNLAAHLLAHRLQLAAYAAGPATPR
jgi:hypothetical protein